MNASPHVQSPLMNEQHEVGSRRTWLWPVVSAVLGLLFIYAGVLKVWDPLHFASDILNYRIISYPLAVRLAFYLPWLEIICGLALIIGFLRAGSIAILSGLMLVFTAITIVTKARGLNIDCGCFGGVSKGLSFTSHLLIDLAILTGLLLLWFKPSRRAD